jgi:putative transposase
MSTQRFTPEFKEEAVRQIVDRGYLVAELSSRLGVSSHNLYQWVKAVTPDKTEQQAAELIDAKSEILKLRAQFHRTEEERDILKSRFINGHRHEFRIATMCRVLQVARAGFYQWLHKPISDHPIEDRRLLGLIRDSYAISGGRLRRARILGDLREAGETWGKHRVARIMRIHKIKAVRGYKAPRPIAGRPSILALNRLNREFTVDAPDRAWVTDPNLGIVVSRGRHGLASVLDRRVVDEADAGSRAGPRRTPDGVVAAQAAGLRPPAFSPRDPVRQ